MTNLSGRAMGPVRALRKGRVDNASVLDSPMMQRKAPGVPRQTPVEHREDVAELEFPRHYAAWGRGTLNS